VTGNGLRDEHSGEPLDPSLKPAAPRQQAERRHFLDGIGFQSVQEAVPPSWRAPLDDLISKLADRDFLEFTRKTALRVRRYGVTGLVADKELIDAASDAAKAWAAILAQLKMSYGDGVEAVSAGIKNETVAAANILDDLSTPNFLIRSPAAGDEQPPK
jgi:hypothetical protein